MRDYILVTALSPPTKWCVYTVTSVCSLPDQEWELTETRTAAQGRTGQSTACEEKKKKDNTLIFSILSNDYAIVSRCILGTLGTFEGKDTKTDSQEMVL